MNNIFIVGSPNVGKSTLFNKITWKLSKVANYDNVTFKNSNGQLRSNKNINIVDTPGIYSIDSKYKENEILKYLLDNKTSVCSIISTCNIERDLFLTIDLFESGNLEYVVLNKINSKNEKYNIFNLERKLNTKVFEVNGNTGSGIRIFSNYISNNYNDNYELKNNSYIKYNKKIESFIEDIEKLDINIGVTKRFYAIQFLIENMTIINHSKKNKYFDIIKKLTKKNKLSNSDIQSIFNAKKQFLSKLLGNFIENKNITKNNFNKNSIFNRLLDNSYFIVILFIVSIFGIYFLTFSQWTGTYLQDLMNNGFDQLKTIIETSMINSGIDSWWVNFVKDGMFDGIFTTLSFIPWIIILTFLTTLLEQIGFLSRVSLATDKILEKFGISGRTLVNLFMGTGCNIPAIMMCKNCSSKKEKIITIMIMPLISCSARVVVYGWIVQAFNIQAYNFLFIFSLTLISFLISLFTGLLFSNTMFRKSKTIFASEIIQWRLPDISTICKTVLLEVYSFIKKVIILIFIINLAIWVLTNVSFTGIITDGNTSKSILRYLSYPFEYILYPTGIFLNNQDSWKLSMSLIASFPAKEIAASNLEILFGGSSNFGIYLKTSLPYTWSALLSSYISFFMFYLPCVATAVTIWKELGWKYLVLNIVSIFCGTYLLSCIIYSVVGSISLFINGITNISIIAIFSTLIFISSLLLIIKIVRVYLQNKGLFESKKINKLFKYTNWSVIGILATLLITNNVLILNI